MKSSFTSTNGAEEMSREKRKRKDPIVFDARKDVLLLRSIIAEGVMASSHGQTLKKWDNVASCLGKEDIDVSSSTCMKHFQLLLKSHTSGKPENIMDMRRLNEEKTSG